MTTFVYRCPNTALKMQRFSDDESPDGGSGGYYITFTCNACGQIHLVNPKTGRVFGGDDLGAAPLARTTAGAKMMSRL